MDIQPLRAGAVERVRPKMMRVAAGAAG